MGLGNMVQRSEVVESKRWDEDKKKLGSFTTPAFRGWPELADDGIPAASEAAALILLRDWKFTRLCSAHDWYAHSLQSITIQSH